MGLLTSGLRTYVVPIGTRVSTAEELQEEINPELDALCDRMLEIIQLEQIVGFHH